ncbi:hypothetical protein RND71_011445 [Anisodus tanguticus]|uniref:Uncharacterized protein n=1 Tax=Anisodus tanguticus TaxID=243964 RepID=A0AAE1SDZ7_9SOLA|nr:hypothetical protein RND71_011445 [Anisodus tanguticus]
MGSFLKNAKILYRDGKNDLPEDFIFGSCHVDTKDWFEALAHSGRPLKDTQALSAQNVYNFIQTAELDLIN